MIDHLVDIDKSLFLAVHSDMANPVFDQLMPFLREATTWIPLYLVFIILAIQRFKKQGIYIVLIAVITVILTDQFSAGFMKPYFERLRPCHDPSLASFMRNLIDCGGQFGFTSSHATNHFGLAVIFTWFFRKLFKASIINWIFYLWAGVISFAQVYVAKHFPGDVLIGAITGILIGLTVLTIYKRIATST